MWQVRGVETCETRERKAKVPRREGSPFRGEKTERGETGWESSRSGLPKKNTSLKPVTRESRGTIAKFCNEWSSNFEVSEVHAICWSWAQTGTGAPGEKESRNPGADSGHCGMGIPWVTLGKNVPLPVVHMKRDLSTPRTKDQAGDNEQLFNSRGQKCVQRADNLVTAFFCASL